MISLNPTTVRLSIRWVAVGGLLITIKSCISSGDIQAITVL